MVENYLCLNETPASLGGHQVLISSGEPLTDGHYAVHAMSNQALICVMPTFEEACLVANTAIQPHGGYGSVYLTPSTLQVTHDSYQSWYFG